MKINLGPKIKSFIAPLVLLSFFFFILNFTSFSKDIKNFFFLISSPAQKSLWQAGESVSDFFAGIFGPKIIKEELNQLYFKNQELSSQLVAALELKKENLALRQALGLGLEKEFQLKLVQVVSKDILQDSLLINKGKKDGLIQGQPVITSKKVLLGRVGQVYDNFSEVILISSKKSSFDAKIIQEDNPHEEIYGLVKGKGSLQLEFDLIPKEKEVFENDLVITSVLGGVYPAGLLVGTIKTIKKSDIEAFQTAQIDPIFKIPSLNYLFIISEF